MKMLELHQMGHENLRAFSNSEISSAPVYVIINGNSFMFTFQVKEFILAGKILYLHFQENIYDTPLERAPRSN